MAEQGSGSSEAPGSPNAAGAARGAGGRLRLLIGLASPAEWSRVEERLRTLGLDEINPPTPELPDVAIALVPATENVEALIQRLTSVEGVAFAELDQLRFTTG